MKVAPLSIYLTKSPYTEQDLVVNAYGIAISPYHIDIQLIIVHRSKTSSRSEIVFDSGLLA